MNRGASAQTDNSCPDVSQPDSNGNCPTQQGSSDNPGGGSDTGKLILKGGCLLLLKNPSCLALQGRAR